MNKLTAPQRKALEHAANGNGTIVVNYAFSIITLRNLDKLGLIEWINWQRYAITEAGLDAIGRADDWVLVHLEICQIKWQHERQGLRASGKVITYDIWSGSETLDYETSYYNEDRRYWLHRRCDCVSEALDAAIELTRAELRAGLV